ncbi:unnamed protein product, partial [Vitrella brassicaformis CCMP3155]
PPRAEEVQAESYLITDPEECLGLLPALFGVSDDSGHVPPGWDLSADDLQAIMGKWEQNNPLPDDDEADEGGDDGEWYDNDDEDARAVRRRIRNAMRHNRNTHTSGHVRLSDTTRRIQAAILRSRTWSRRSSRSSVQSRVSRAGNNESRQDGSRRVRLGRRQRRNSDSSGKTSAVMRHEPATENREFLRPPNEARGLPTTARGSRVEEQDPKPTNLTEHRKPTRR